MILQTQVIGLWTDILLQAYSSCWMAPADVQYAKISIRAQGQYHVDTLVSFIVLTVACITSVMVCFTTSHMQHLVLCYALLVLAHYLSCSNLPFVPIVSYLV